MHAARADCRATHLAPAQAAHSLDTGSCATAGSATATATGTPTPATAVPTCTATATTTTTATSTQASTSTQTTTAKRYSDGLRHRQSHVHPDREGDGRRHAGLGHRGEYSLGRRQRLPAERGDPDPAGHHRHHRRDPEPGLRACRRLRQLYRLRDHHPLGHAGRLLSDPGRRPDQPAHRRQPAGRHRADGHPERQPYDLRAQRHGTGLGDQLPAGRDRGDRAGQRLGGGIAPARPGHRR